MVNSRHPFAGTNSTRLSPDVYGNPEGIALNNLETEAMRDADELAALVTFLERSRPAWHSNEACRGSDIESLPDTESHRLRNPVVPPT